MPPGVADIPEEVVSVLYGKSATKSVNKARFQLFNGKYAGNQRRSFAKIKGFNSSRLPPCASPFALRRCLNQPMLHMTGNMQICQIQYMD